MQCLYAKYYFLSKVTLCSQCFTKPRKYFSLAFQIDKLKLDVFPMLEGFAQKLWLFNVFQINFQLLKLYFSLPFVVFSALVL